MRESDVQKARQIINSLIVPHLAPAMWQDFSSTKINASAFVDDEIWSDGAKFEVQVCALVVAFGETTDQGTRHKQLARALSKHPSALSDQLMSCITNGST